MRSAHAKFRTGREIEAFFEELGERSVLLALQSRMRFPMPFGEYHAAMWLARRRRERRAQETWRLELLRHDAKRCTAALEHAQQFAAGAAMVALIALAFSGLKS